MQALTPSILLTSLLAALCASACQEATERIDPRDLYATSGRFPGAPCRPEGDARGRCDVDLGGRADADMTCIQNVCALTCDRDPSVCGRELGFAYACASTAGGVCAERCVAGCDDGFECFDRDGVCLPIGSIPGGSCRPADDPAGACDADVVGVADAHMRCERGRCVIGCEQGGDALCAEVNADLGCVEDAGVCAEKCLGTDACRDPALECFTRAGVCLPPGTFPGSACRADDDPEGVCDSDVNGVADADMRCVDGLCLIDCAAGGDALCAEVSPELGCAETAGNVCAERCLDDGGCADLTFGCFTRDDVCLPIGSFPGGPCRPSSDPAGRCDPDVNGVVGADMVCKRDACLIDCSVGGDLLCGQVSADAKCSDAAGGFCFIKCREDGGCDEAGLECFAEEGLCLPRGSFPGSPCAEGAAPCAHDLRDDPNADMKCVEGYCVLACDEGGDARCAGIDDRLTCFERLGACVPHCEADGSCTKEGLTCLSEENACLPIGGFPGSPCRAEAGDEADRCDTDLFGVDALDMACVDDTCLVSCKDGGDGICMVVDESLGCAMAAGGYCVKRCDADAAGCDEGFSCFEAEGVCLPTGAFPSSPCRAADDPAGPCDSDVGGVAEADMRCLEGVCVIDCAQGGDATCAAVDASLTCAETVGVCFERCQYDGTCRDPDFECFARDGVCAPRGSFPGSSCRAADDPAGPCDSDVNDVPDADMTCIGGLCVIDCQAGGDALCAEVNPALGCSESLGICAETCLEGDECADLGFACFTYDEVCLPLGSVPGGPCRRAHHPDGPCDADVAGVAGADMRCVNDRCVIDCKVGGDAMCAEVSPRLTCGEAGVNICAQPCLAGGGCELSGLACYADAGVCLPLGSFPGSPCRDSALPCDQDINGDINSDMKCIGGTCLVCRGDLCLDQ